MSCQPPRVLRVILWRLGQSRKHVTDGLSLSWFCGWNGEAYVLVATHADHDEAFARLSESVIRTIVEVRKQSVLGQLLSHQVQIPSASLLTEDGNVLEEHDSRPQFAGQTSELKHESVPLVAVVCPALLL